jgi:magnesium transporter
MNNVKKISKKINKIMIDNPEIKKELDWYNVLNPEKKEIKYLKKNFGFSEKHLELSLTTAVSQRPAIHKGEDYLFIILHFPVMIDGKIEPGEIEIFMSHKLLVTLHDGKTEALTKFFRKLSEDQIFSESYKYESSTVLLYEILQALIEESFHLLDQNNIEITKIENYIFASRQKPITQKLLTLKRSIINIRRIVQNHENIMKKLSEMESSLVPQEQIRSYYDTLAEHSQRIWEFSEIQKEIIESLHQTSESITSYRINNIMKTLTVVSVLIMPLNLFVNLFGMNVDPSPMQANTPLFINIITTVAVMAIILLLFFKKKKWL